MGSMLPKCQRKGYMMTTELDSLINATIERIISGTIEDMKDDMIHEVDPHAIYAKTESLLYNLPMLKNAVQERREQIKEIEQYGLRHGSKSFTVFIPNKGMVDTKNEYEKELDKIEQLQGVICELESRIAQIEKAVATVKDNPYFSIIEMKYFKKKTVAEIAEKLQISDTTVKRQKNKMLESIKFSLFNDLILEEMIGWIM